MTGPAFPDKFYFKIGEVASILGVQPHVVRFWESEFNLAPAKNRSKHRVYRRQDVEALIEIRRLLYEDRFTIEGARKRLKERLRERNRQLALALRDEREKALLARIKKDLMKIRDILGERAGGS